MQQFRVEEAKTMLESVWLVLVGNPGEELGQNKLSMALLNMANEDAHGGDRYLGEIVKGPLPSASRIDTIQGRAKDFFDEIDETIERRKRNSIYDDGRITEYDSFYVEHYPQELVADLALRVRELHQMLDALHKATLLFEKNPYAGNLPARLRELEDAYNKVIPLFNDEFKQIFKWLEHYKNEYEDLVQKDKLLPSVITALALLTNHRNSEIKQQEELPAVKQIQKEAPLSLAVRNAFQQAIDAGFENKTTSRYLTVERLKKID